MHLVDNFWTTATIPQHLVELFFSRRSQAGLGGHVKYHHFMHWQGRAQDTLELAFSIERRQTVRQINCSV